MFTAIRHRLSAGMWLTLVGGLIVISFCLCAGAVLQLGQSTLKTSGLEMRGLGCINTAWQYQTTENPEVLENYAPCVELFDPSGLSGSINQYKDDSARQKILLRLFLEAGDRAKLFRDADPAGANLAEIQIRRMPALWSAAVNMEQAIRMPPSEARAAQYEKVRTRLQNTLTHLDENYAVVFRDDPEGKRRAALQPLQAEIRRAASALLAAGNLAIYHHRAGFVKAWDGWQQTLISIWPDQQQALSEILQNRMSLTREKRLIYISFIVLFVVLSLAALGLVGTVVTQRFHMVEQSLQRLNTGVPEVDFSFLAARRETRGIAAELIRLRQTLEKTAPEDSGALLDAEQRIAAVEQRAADAEAQAGEFARRAENTEKQLAAAEQRGAAAEQLMAEAELRATASEKLVHEARENAKRSAEMSVTLASGLRALAEGESDINLGLPEDYGALEEAFDAVAAALNKIRRERDANTAKLEASLREEETARQAAEEKCRSLDVAQLALTEQVNAALGDGLAALAGRDLTFRFHTPAPEELSDLRRDLSVAAGQLSETLCLLDDRASLIARACSSIRDNAGVLAQRTGDQTVTLEETAAIVADLATRATASANEVEMVYGDADGARRAAQKLCDSFRTAAEALRGVSESAEVTRSLLGALDEIAFQANLLALDAGGPDRQSPAGLAADLRALAGKSADAARGIRKQLTSYAAKIYLGEDLTGNGAGTLSEMVETLSAMADTLLATIRAGREQAKALRGAGAAVQSLLREVRQNTVLAGDADVVRESLVRHAVAMTTELAQFQIRRK